MKGLFENFVKIFDLTQRDIKVKYHHSYRVKVLCEMLAKELKLNDRQIWLASVCGMFHDVGRFEQLTKHNTYDDFISFDHGDLGYDIFLNELSGQLDLTEEEKNIVAKAIKYHNKFSVENVTEEELLFANILRDADKIDILYIYANINGFMTDGDGEISQSCYDWFMQHKPIDRRIITTEREKIVLSLGFIWDINFEYSYKIIKDNKYYKKIKQNINNNIFDDYFNEIEKFLEEK